MNEPNNRIKPEPGTKEIIGYDSRGNRHVVTLYKATDIDGNTVYANRHGRIIPAATYHERRRS